jgi:hypothetical protein
MSVIEHLAVELTLEGAKFTTELTRALSLTEKMSSQFQVNFSRMGKELASVGKLAAGMGIAMTTAAAAGIGVMAVQAFNAGDKLNKMADKIGVSVEWLQQMDWVARQTGTSIESITSSFRFLERAMVAAKDPTSQQALLFKQLGLSIAEVTAMKPEDRFEAVRDALSKVGDQSQRTVATMALLGRGASDMALLVKGSADKVSDLKKEISDTGTVLGKQDYNKLEAAADALELMEQYAAGVAKVIGSELSPFVVQLVEDFTQNENAIDNVRDAMKWLVDATFSGVAVIVDAVRIFQIAWHAAKAVVASLSVTMYEVRDSVSAVLSYLYGILSNFGMAVGNVWYALYETSMLAWEGLKSGVTLVMNSIQATIGGSLIAIGKALSYLPGSVGKSVEDAGRSMVTGTKKSTEEAANALKLQANVVSEAWKEAGAQIGEAVSSFNFNKATEGYKSESNKLARVAEKEYWEQLNDILNKPFEGKGIIEWKDRARKNLDMKTATTTKKGRTVDDSGNTELDLEADARQKKLDALRAQVGTETEIEMAEYNKRVSTLNEMKDADFAYDGERNKLREQIEQEHQDRLLAISSSAAGAQMKLWRSGWEGKMSVASQYLGNIATLMNSKNKQMFEIGKIAAYAQTVVNTAEAAMSSFKFGSAIGGPVLGAAFAATAVAAGMVQLQTISSASFGGGGSVSAGGGGSPSGAPMPGELNNQGIPSMQQAPQQTIYLSVEGDFVSRDAVFKLIDQINDARRDGARIEAA